jgi:hypothetical protein
MRGVIVAIAAVLIDGGLFVTVMLRSTLPPRTVVIVLNCTED